MAVNIISNVKNRVRKMGDLIKVDYELRVIERSIQEMAHLAYDYRFSAMPDAPQHYKDCQNYLSVLRLKKGLKELEREIIAG